MIDKNNDKHITKLYRAVEISLRRVCLVSSSRLSNRFQTRTHTNTHTHTRGKLIHAFFTELAFKLTGCDWCTNAMEIRGFSFHVSLTPLPRIDKNPTSRLRGDSLFYVIPSPTLFFIMYISTNYIPERISWFHVIVIFTLEQWREHICPFLKSWFSWKNQHLIVIFRNQILSVNFKDKLLIYSKVSIIFFYLFINGINPYYNFKYIITINLNIL